jgi:hypothetical protein
LQQRFYRACRDQDCAQTDDAFPILRQTVDPWVYRGPSKGERPGSPVRPVLDRASRRACAKALLVVHRKSRSASRKRSRFIPFDRCLLRGMNEQNLRRKKRANTESRAPLRRNTCQSSGITILRMLKAWSMHFKIPPRFRRGLRNVGGLICAAYLASRTSAAIAMIHLSFCLEHCVRCRGPLLANVLVAFAKQRRCSILYDLEKRKC